jgi:hypothetical protein
MVQLPPQNSETNFRSWLPLNSAHEVFSSLGHVVHKFGLRYSEPLASLIGCGSIVRVRR